MVIGLTAPKIEMFTFLGSYDGVSYNSENRNQYYTMCYGRNDIYSKQLYMGINRPFGTFLI